VTKLVIPLHESTAEPLQATTEQLIKASRLNLPMLLMKQSGYTQLGVVVREEMVFGI
jgi:hypothetical protein